LTGRNLLRRTGAVANLFDGEQDGLTIARHGRDTRALKMSE
jgi:hypothetical protein